MDEKNIQRILKTKSKWMHVLRFYVISLDLDGSGSDYLTATLTECIALYKEYWQYLVDNSLTGKVTIREALVEGQDYDPYIENPQIFFDACDWDKMPVLHSKTYSPKGMKSTAALTAQIQRIFKNHAEHRLYDKALGLVMRYNDRITDTPEHTFYHENWCWVKNDPDRQEEAARWLHKLNHTRYHRSLYAGNAG